MLRLLAIVGLAGAGGYTTHAATQLPVALLGLALCCAAIFIAGAMANG